MQIQVYHVSSRATRDQRLDAMMGFNEAKHAQHCAELWALGLYDHVATVNTDELGASPAPDHLELAWRLTNSVDHAWCQGNGLRVVNRFEGNGCRSTSVGDVMVIAGQENMLHVAASFGFNGVELAVSNGGVRCN